MFDWTGYNQSDLLFLGDWSLWAVLLLAALGAMVISLSWYDLRDMRGRKRWSLVLLRTAIYLLAIALLLEPALELKNVTKIKNHVVVLLDTSRSQILKTDEDGTTRLDLAQSALKDEDLVELFTTPNEEHTFDFFAFDTELKPSSLEELSHPDFRSEGDQTRILESLEEATRRIGRRDLGGVILLSDGIDGGLLGGRVNRGEDLDKETLAFLKRLDVPIHTLATATNEDLKDLSVEQVFYDDFAFVRNKISIDVVLRVVGFEPSRIPVSLRREGKLIQTREVEVGPDATEYKVSFELVPQQIGKEIYTITTPAYSGEALLENNRKDIVLKIIRDKIRVLHVVGRPSWDQRFLRQHLKQNPNVDLVSFFILRTAENAQVAPNNEMSLIPFPTRELFEEQLGSFDLVIFQNFNFRPYNMARYLQRVSKYVKDGGGFVMIGGELTFSSGAYQNTPIADILPVNLLPYGTRQTLLSEARYQVQLAETGERHPITQLAFDPAVNKERWSKLPSLEGANILSNAKPGATVLGTHPTLTAAGKPMPIIAIQEVGKGRSMIVATDTTWKWSFDSVAKGSTSRPYHTFWNASIRWLIKDPELKLIKVDIDDTTVPPGSQVPVIIRVSRPDYTPAINAKVKVTVLRRPLEVLSGEAPSENADELVLTQDLTTDDQGRAFLNLPKVKSGAWTVLATATTDSGKLQDEDLFLVTLDSQELRTIEPREALLQQLSEATGGTYNLLPDLDADLDFKEARVVQVNRRKVIDLWDSFYVFFLICALLAIEWTLRRRWGRL